MERRNTCSIIAAALPPGPALCPCRLLLWRPLLGKESPMLGRHRVFLCMLTLNSKHPVQCTQELFRAGGGRRRLQPLSDRDPASQFAGSAALLCHWIEVGTWQSGMRGISPKQSQSPTWQDRRGLPNKALPCYIASI